MDAGNTSVSEKYKTRLLEPKEVFQKKNLKIFEKRIVAIDYPHNYTPQTYPHAIKQIY